MATVWVLVGFFSILPVYMCPIYRPLPMEYLTRVHNFGLFLYIYIKNYFVLNNFFLLFLNSLVYDNVKNKF